MSHLLLLLFIAGHVASLPITEVVTKEDNRNDRNQLYQLPGESVPTFYDVRLLLDPNNEEGFSGNVSIRIIPLINTNQIVLHAMELSILSVSVVHERSAIELFDNFTLEQDDTHLLRIGTSELLNALEPYEVHISYEGKYAANMFGIYLSSYEQDGSPQRLITSQLQPTFARRAFPCYDEPAMKAVFRTTIYAPATYPVVRSNMPAKTENFIQSEIPGLIKFEFEDTLVMSTYLLAYLVSSFSYIDNTQDPIYSIPFRVYSRPGTQNTAEFALEFGQENMVALENYTDMAFAFPKLDNAAVPDFAAGAMENWGLVVYREVALLYQKGVTTTATLQSIGRIISHENAHQWFGNEVGPQSWTFTWLNEGFANFFESFATNLIRPDWRTMDQFVLQVHGVFQNDAVLSVNSMTHPVYTPSEIMGTFNAVAYQKSGSVIRMMQHFLTPEVFRRGLVIYLQNRSRKAATPSDLFTAMQQALNESNHTIPYTLVNVMTRWTEQGGFPVLTVRKSAPTANSLAISQQRYLTDSHLSSNELWHVPLNWVLSSDPDFEDTRPQGWLPVTSSAQSYDIQGLGEAEWYIINKQQTGYYRVNYDLNNWAALARVLQTNHTNIHVLNRANLLDDAFNLARTGRLSYEYAFEISRYLARETDYIPWATVNTAFNYLDIMLGGADIYDYFKMYLLDLTKNMFDELGFEITANDEHVTAYHRNILLDINCRYGNEDCVNKAQLLLAEFQVDPSLRLDADIQTTVYCASLRGGSSSNYKFLWKLYEDSTDSSEKSILLNSLGCINDVELRQQFMNQVIDDNSIVREQDRHTILVATINSNPESMEHALDFVIEQFHEIQQRVQGLSGTTNILNAFSRRLTTEAHLEKIAELERRHQDIFTAGELASIAAIKENIAASLTWSNENLATVDVWLKSHYKEGSNNANALTSSLVVLVALVSMFIAQL